MYIYIYIYISNFKFVLSDGVCYYLILSVGLLGLFPGQAESASLVLDLEISQADSLTGR